MKVRDLIDKLHGFDAELEVLCCDDLGDTGGLPVTNVTFGLAGRPMELEKVVLVEFSVDEDGEVPLSEAPGPADEPGIMGIHPDNL